MAEEAAHAPGQSFTCDVTGLTPGKTRVFEHAGQRVLVCNADGVYYAIEDQCSHAAFPLDGGRLKGCILECPVHGAKFDVRDGTAVRVPARKPVKTFSISVTGGRAEISLGD
jgi:nitrite reductase/ring-hydroxylating ferredoxin subunit